LWRGQKASVASDIYALGVILYETLSGTPLQKTNALREERLTWRPPPVHPKWDRILGRCLEADAALRDRSVEEIEGALKPRSQKWVWAAAAAVALATVTGVVTRVRSVAPPETVRLAVLPFETDPGGGAMSNGLLNDTAERLRRIKSGPKTKL